MKFIHLPAFIISLAIGIFLAYTTLPGKKIIYVYPTPETYDKIQYKDKNGVCMDVDKEKIKCTSDIKSHPIYI